MTDWVAKSLNPIFKYSLKYGKHNSNGLLFRITRGIDTEITFRGQTWLIEITPDFDYNSFINYEFAIFDIDSRVVYYRNYPLVNSITKLTGHLGPVINIKYNRTLDLFHYVELRIGEPNSDKV